MDSDTVDLLRRSAELRASSQELLRLENDLVKYRDELFQRSSALGADLIPIGIMPCLRMATRG